MDSDKLSVLLDERCGMRIAIQEIEKAQHKIVFATLTLIVAGVGTIFGGNRILDADALGRVVLIFSQTIFLLTIFNFQLMRNMAVKAIYSSVVEEEINKQFQQNISSFASVCQRYLYSPKCIAYWVAVLFILAILCSFALFYIFLINTFPDDIVIFSIVFGFELLLAVVVFILSLLEDRRIIVYARYARAKPLAEIKHK
jgi:drug/metabolite transporter (DMT)-like permease